MLLVDGWPNADPPVLEVPNPPNPVLAGVVPCVAGFGKPNADPLVAGPDSVAPEGFVPTTNIKWGKKRGLSDDGCNS